MEKRESSEWLFLVARARPITAVFSKELLFSFYYFGKSSRQDL
jgi:hypothetical protein